MGAEGHGGSPRPGCRTGADDCKGSRRVRDQRPDENRSVVGGARAQRARRSAPRAPLAAARASRRRGDRRRRLHRASRRPGTCAQRRPELGIALLEAGVLGQGASGRNGGQVLNWINGVDAGRRRGAAPHPRRRRGAGIDLAEELAARFAPPGTFRRQGCLEVYTDRATRGRRGRARGGAARARASPRSSVPASALGVHGACGARARSAGGSPQRLRAAAGDAAACCVGAASRCYEHTPVLRVRAGREIVLRDARRRACARARSCSRPTPTRRRSASSATASCRSTRTCWRPAPLARARWRALGWGDWDGFTDDLDRIAYACRTPAAGCSSAAAATRPTRIASAGRPASAATRPRRRARRASCTAC